MMEYMEMYEGIQTSTVMSGWLLASDMVYINKLELKDLNMMLWHSFESEKLKGIANKVELIEDFM